MYSAVKNSLSSGGIVHLLCRNEDRANEARKDIVEQSKNEVYLQKYIYILWELFHMLLGQKQCLSLSLICFQNIHVHLVDMSSPRKVWEFASGFSQKHNLHVLVNVFQV